MTTYDMTDFAAQVDGVLRPLGITRNMRAYHTLSEALRLICEQEDRLEAVQKEIYEPLADRHCCDWTAIQSMIRRAAQTAWATNPTQVQRLAGYPLTGCPSAVQFLELLYNGMVRGVQIALAQKVGCKVGSSKRKAPGNLRF